MSKVWNVHTVECLLSNIKNRCILPQQHEGISKTKEASTKARQTYGMSPFTSTLKVAKATFMDRNQGSLGLREGDTRSF